ncbi:uncharacterized protein ACWYII_046783 isoform 2-T2 [Salvelinus alpinus]
MEDGATRRRRPWIRGEGEAEGFERFEGNIAGFISYFLPTTGGEPEREAGPEEAGGRIQEGGTERRARRQRGGGGGRVRGAVKKGSEVEQPVMEVSQRARLWKWGVRACRMGRGGGMISSKLPEAQGADVGDHRYGGGEGWSLAARQKEREGPTECRAAACPGAESLTGKCPPPVNRTIRSAEKIKSQTKARPASV